jgi:MarR-like DNA-binding transcriptional regulator SgrR of sgrS sRNA
VTRPRDQAKFRNRDRPRRRNHSDDEEDKNLNTVMMKNLTAITASHLKRDTKESMLSQLMAPEGKRLFDLLSASDWEDSDPKMNTFVKGLVFDKDSNRASGIMLTRMKKWSGEISNKGLLNFFAGGFAAKETQECPGG